MLDDAGVAVVLTQERISETLPAHWGQIICLDTEWDDIAKRSTENPARAVADRNVAYLIYTSGSTGWPKGVLVDHGNLVQSTQVRLGYYGGEPFTAISAAVVVRLRRSVAGLFGTLCGGAGLVLVNEDTYRDAAYLRELIDRHRVSHLLTLPSFYALLLEELGSGCSSCR